MLLGSLRTCLLEEAVHSLVAERRHQECAIAALKALPVPRHEEMLHPRPFLRWDKAEKVVDGHAARALDAGHAARRAILLCASRRTQHSRRVFVDSVHRQRTGECPATARDAAQTLGVLLEIGERSRETVADRAAVFSRR